MRNHLTLMLWCAALLACQQQPASEPTARDTAAAPVTVASLPAANSGARPTVAATAAATADAAAAAPCVGDDCAKPASGYGWAQAHHIDDERNCNVGSQDFRDGCKLYVQEKGIDEGEKEFESDVE